jgi:hypothetical protein
VLATLRYQRNRPYLHALIFVLMLSWLSMLVSATCAMPMAWRSASAEVMPAGCSGPGNHTPVHSGQPSMPDQGCSFKPCMDSQPNPAFEFKIDKPQMPVFVLCLIGLIGYLFHYIPLLYIPRATASPPIGRRILLIYRYCTLLN